MNLMNIVEQNLEQVREFPKFKAGDTITVSYKIKEGEMYVGKMTESIKKQSVIKAFERAREIQHANGFIAGPQEIEGIGAKYLYPIFLRLGICTQSCNSGDRY